MVNVEPKVYEIIGEEGFERLIRAFYKQVPDDDILGPMYPADDLDGAEQRLRDFLIGRFGGRNATSSSAAIPACACAMPSSPSISAPATVGCS